jgi:hypothetical protein
MAYVNPTDQTTGYLVPAVDYNLNNDNIRFLRTPPQARVYHNANQSITTAVETALALNSERFDNDVIHDTVTNNSRLTCKTAGKYAIGGHIEWAVNATGTRLARIRLNGATFIASSDGPVAGHGTYNIRNNVMTLYDLAVNDYVELMAFQDSGAGLNVLVTGNLSPEFWMQLVG